MVIIVTILLAVLIGVSVYFLKEATHPRVMPYDKTFEFEAKENNIDIEAFHELEKLELFMVGHRGHKIHGFLIPGKREKTVIISHGYTLSLAGSIKYAEMFLNRGYSVFIYDHRNHGLSTRSFTSFGHYESEDLKHIIANLRKRSKNKVKIGLMGESLGAATVLQYIGKHDDVDFVIADCPFSDVKDLFDYRMKYDYGVGSKLIINATSLLSRLLQGWSFRVASSKGKMKNVLTPTLFIHGEEDRYIPKEMTIDMYNEKSVNKWLYIAPEARHAKSFSQNPVAYKERVYAFLEEIGF